MAATPHPDDAPRRGRRPKLTEEVIKAAAELLLQGNFRCVVARRLGIGARTWHRWLSDGHKFPDGLYGRFRQAVIEAEQEFHCRAVAAIVAAGTTEDPRLMLEYLSRKYPQLYGRYRGELGELKRRIRELEGMLGLNEDDDGEATSPVPA